MAAVKNALTLILVAGALTGCPNQGIQAINASPESTIVSHSDGDEVLEGTSVAFWGVASDPDHQPEELTAIWYLNGIEICPATAADADGMSSCEAVIGPDDDALVLEVQDPKGAAGAATVSLVVVPSDTPVASINAPEATGIYYSDQLVVFEGEVGDSEDSPSTLTAWWSSSLDGDLDVQADPSSAGELLGSGYLGEGEHAITLHAQDSSGKTGTDSVIVSVGPPNSAPSCAITEPADGAAAEQGETVVFRGEVEDEDVPADWLAVAWESDKDGSLGSSAPDSSGEVALAWAELTQGTHTITMSVEDEVGATCSDFILFTVGTPPTTEITVPVTGTSFDEDELVSFEGTVSDAEDSASSLTISWDSSLDGVLDETGADSSGTAMFSSSALQIGEHSITLTATDTDGLYSRDMITLTITECTDEWFADADGDGFGDPATSLTVCDPPTGYVADDTDCDDGNAGISPDDDETCNGVDDDCDGIVDEDDATDASTWYADADGDSYGDPASATTACAQPSGHVSDVTDCDDGDAAVSPAADEYCDGVDNDCDGDTDEDESLDASTWYADTDADGYGNASTSTTACSRPTGYVSDDTDCDDVNAAVYPGADEYCNGIDDDCDGDTDEDEALDVATWYQDRDEDGFGDTARSTVNCSAPSGYVSDDTDCDDLEVSTYPGADEYCNGVDDDCDGDTDEDDALDVSTWYADADSDSYGDASSADIDCDQPTGFVGDATDCDDTDSSANPGADEYCDGVDNDCDGAMDEDDALDASAWYADADADGYGDTSSTTYACTQPSGHVSDDTDCDDGRAESNPGADEYCNGEDDDCDGATDEDDALDVATWYQDRDEDGYGDPARFTDSCSAPSGYVADNTDCDDLNVSANPGADEYCNGTDDDCDGTTDEGDALDASSWYTDGDADGYGDPGSSTDACSQPSGFVADATDCDDSTSAVSPAEDETCNGVDDNCDGTIDEDEATDASTWYADDDSDGYGDATAPTDACSQPTGYLSDAADCDDSDSSINPGADEYCNGVDDDCDGATDEDDAVDASIWFSDADGDGFGDGTSSTTCCDQPSDYVSDTTDCNDSDATVNPGADEYCNGVDDDCDGTTDEDDAVDASTWYSDSDGDGYGDPSTTTIYCEQPSGYVGDATDCDATSTTTNPGAEEICGDGIDQDCSGTDEDCRYSGPHDLASVGIKLIGETDDDHAGWAMSSAGDVNADGYDDILVGSYGNDEGGGNAGAAYLVYGPLTADLNLADADAKMIGAAASDWTGYSVSTAGDIDMDGYDDLIVGAPLADDGGTNSGAAFIMHGPMSGDLDLTSPDAMIIGESADDQAGYSAVAAGDVNGDGTSDVLLVAPWVGLYSAATYPEGAAYVVYGPITDDIDLGSADSQLTNEASGSLAGLWSGSSAGDVDGDGYDDILLGSTYDDDGGSNAGAAYLVNGPLSVDIDLEDADSKFIGETTNDYAGASVASAGDVNNDGYDDILIGAQYDDDAASNAGAAYVFLGPISGDADLSAADAKLLGAAASDYAGSSVGSAGDVDADGMSDILVGAPYADEYGSSSGTTYLLYGPITADMVLSDADAAFHGESAGDRAGAPVMSAGDVDADGYDDLLIGAYGDDDGGKDAGAAYLILFADLP